MGKMGITKEEYADFIENGGEIVLNIPRSELSHKDEFEEWSLIKPLLFTGFEIKPTAAITYDSKFYVDVTLQGTDFSRIIALVYSRQGSIVYKKLEDGSYEARCTLPATVPKA